jgi:small subunit ribosomal protein S4
MQCVVCRREGMKLFLKGAKCFAINVLSRSATRSRTTWEDRKAKIVGYGLQLRESRKRSAFTSPGSQFPTTSRKPRAQGRDRRVATATEQRLTTSCSVSIRAVRRQARQLVRHGQVAVDNRKVNIPSYEVSAGEEISIRENSKKLAVLELAKEFSSHGTLPSWLEVDRDNYKARILNLPKREDIQLPVNEQLIVELYSK